MSRLHGRLFLRIEEKNVGKKRDAWQNARDASRLAEGRVSDCNGGSTLDAMLQAQLDRQNAAIEEHFTYNEWQEDPEG